MPSDRQFNIYKCCLCGKVFAVERFRWADRPVILRFPDNAMIPKHECGGSFFGKGEPIGVFDENKFPEAHIGIFNITELYFIDGTSARRK